MISSLVRALISTFKARRELAKLGISISQAAVSKYMVRHRTPSCAKTRPF